MGYTRFPDPGSSAFPAIVSGAGAAGAPDTGVVTVQGILGGYPLPVTFTGFNGKSASWLEFLDYGTTPITTAAYVQLIASTPLDINYLSIFDSSGSGMILAVGAPGSEVDQLYVPPGGSVGGYDLFIIAGSRIAYKALTANATSGNLIITGLK